MIVKVGGKLYSSETMPIQVVLTADEKLLAIRQEPGAGLVAWPKSYDGKRALEETDIKKEELENVHKE